MVQDSKKRFNEKALLTEIEKRGMTGRRQAPVEVFYDETPAGLFFLDILVEEQVVVEIKAFAHQLTGDELAQVINYVKAGEFPVGLLLNFGRRSLEYRRVFHLRIHHSHPAYRTG